MLTNGANIMQVLDRLRAAAEANKTHVALMLDTKGPEIRTAMLRDHKPIELVRGEETGRKLQVKSTPTYMCSTHCI
jgi:pyruvate kinase